MERSRKEWNPQAKELRGCKLQEFSFKKRTFYVCCTLGGGFEVRFRGRPGEHLKSWEQVCHYISTECDKPQRISTRHGQSSKRTADSVKSEYVQAEYARWSASQKKMVRETIPKNLRHGYSQSAASQFNTFSGSRSPKTCWIWEGIVLGSGYGVMIVQGTATLAHRWSYQHHNCKLSDDLEIHHQCAEKRCVNPSHLKALTREEHEMAHQVKAKWRRSRLGL